jgi:hypothetical protein
LLKFVAFYTGVPRFLPGVCKAGHRVLAYGKPLQNQLQLLFHAEMVILILGNL